MQYISIYGDIDYTYFSFRVLYSQLCCTDDSIKRDQLNADLRSTLQLLIGVLNRFTWYVCQQYLFSLTKLKLEYNQHLSYSQTHWTTSKLDSIVIMIFGQSLHVDS